MSAFRLTKLAKQDLLSIGRYTQKTWGSEQRNRYLTMLDDCFRLLAQGRKLMTITINVTNWNDIIFSWRMTQRRGLTRPQGFKGT
ncbi:MAG: type II toxin-antitoxin system RelE/ParE family toxin [Calothrix sp. MO_192.B10]|nr:type II toxin-antitoxin system RelE/ParE family toxin [Calothrix sp. MO_192.B10]